MPYRVTFFQRQQVSLLAGWTTNFWNNLTDAATVLANAKLLVAKWQKCQGFPVTLTHVRVSLADGLRQVELWESRFTNNPYVSTGADQYADFPTTALLWRLMAQPDYRANLWLRGIHDDVVTENGFYVPGAYSKNVNAVIAELTNASRGWCLRVLDRNQAYKQITNITQAGVVSVASHGYDTGNVIRISRARGLTQVNRQWRVISLDANSFQLEGWVQPATTIPYEGYGVVRKLAYTYPNISGAQIVRSTKHNVGRPFGLFTGKRKKVC